MNPEVKQLWIDALESGEYNQGYGGLKREYGDEVTHCCLGVLCEVAAKAGVSVKSERSVGSTYRYNGEGSFLPYAVRNWADVEDNAGRLSDEVVHLHSTGEMEYLGSLVQLNDVAKYTFQQIADVIREQF